MEISLDFDNIFLHRKHLIDNAIRSQNWLNLLMHQTFLHFKEALLMQKNE